MTTPDSDRAAGAPTTPRTAAPAPAAARAATVPLTVVIPTLDESARIVDAVRAAAWADEVIVVDGGSTDGTPALARDAGATVIECAGRTIGEQRNLGIDRARNEWVLALDADERVTPALRDEIARIAADGAGGPHDAYAIRRIEWFAGRALTQGTFSSAYFPRLFRRRYRFTTVRVHERLEDVPNTGRTRGTLEHHGTPDMQDQLRKMILYTTWQANDMYDRGRTAGITELAFRPAWRFVREYAGGAWRGGTFMFIQVMIAVFSTFLKYALLWMRHDEARRAGERRPS